MKTNNSKSLPASPPTSLSVAGRRVWPMVLQAVIKAGHNEQRYLIGVRRAAECYGEFLKSCEPSGEAYQHAQGEAVGMRRDSLRQILSMFPGAALPFIEEGDELRAWRLWLQLELKEIEVGISGTICEGESWHRLLREQSRLHWRLVTLNLLIDIEDDQRREADDDSDGDEWKSGAGE